MKIRPHTIMDLALILFGLFIIYQLVRRMLGGSWGIETVILGFVIFGLGLTIKNTFDFSSHKGEFKEFKRSMLVMAKDFKEFKKETKDKFNQVEKNIDRKFSKLDKKFNEMDKRFNSIDLKLSK